MTDAPLSTVRNAARVLKAFLTREESLGVSELSRRLGLGKSAVHRLLSTLAAEGQLSVYLHEGFWHPMDTYRDYLHLNALWKQEPPPWKVW